MAQYTECAFDDIEPLEEFVQDGTWYEDEEVDELVEKSELLQEFFKTRYAEMPANAELFKKSVMCSWVYDAGALRIAINLVWSMPDGTCLVNNYCIESEY